MRPLPFWILPNVLGLDAPIIALLWQNAFAVSYGATLSPSMRWGLFFAVWAIYLGDRILDGMRLNITSHSALRHQFAAKYARFMGALMMIAISGAVYNAFYIPRILQLSAWMLGISAAIYFFWNQTARGTFFRRYFKECIISLIFTMGTILAPVLQGASLDYAFFTGAMLFFALCLSNCGVISRIERDMDLARGEESYAIHFNQSIRPARWLALLVTLLCIAATFARMLPLPLAGCIGLSGLGIWFTPSVERLTSTRLATVWADVCLLTPLFIAIWHFYPL